MLGTGSPRTNVRGMMLLRLAGAAFAALLTVGAAAAPAAPPSQQQIAAIDPIARTVIDRQATPSVVIGVGRHGKLVFAKAYGYRNLDDKVPADVETMYAIGSNTKQFTAAAILLLRDAGKLDVDAPVARYLPDLPHGAEVTIRQLLTHTGGYAEFTELPDIDRLANRRATNGEILATVAARPLGFTPGTKWQYSNTGYVILAEVVEKLSGTSYAEFLRERIFAPLGMTRTRYEDQALVESNRAVGYSRFAMGAPEHEDHLDYTWLSGAGAIESTVGDLEKWNDALDRGTLLSASSRAMMHTPMTLADGTDTHYGFGLMLRQLPNGKHVVLHGGDTTGFGSQDARFTDDDLDIVVLTNQEPATYNAIMNAVYVALEGVPAASSPAPLVSTPPSSAPKAAALPPYATAAGDAMARAWLERAVAGTIDAAALRPAFAAQLSPARNRDALRGLARFGSRRYTLVSVDRRAPTSAYEYLLQTSKRLLVYVFSLDDDGKVAGAEVFDPNPLAPDASGG